MSLQDLVNGLTARGHVMQWTDERLTMATVIKRSVYKNVTYLTADSDIRKGLEAGPAGY